MGDVVHVPAPIAGVRFDVSPYDVGSRAASLIIDGVSRGGQIISRGKFKHTLNATGLDTYAYQLLRIVKHHDSGDLFLFSSSGPVHRATSVSSSGAALTAVTTSGFANTDISAFNFGTRIAWAYNNNSHAPRKYDSTSGMATCTFTASSGSTSPSATLYKGGFPFKGRVYWWADEDPSFYYTELDAIDGTVTKFPLGRVSRTGAPVKQIASISLDGGDGPDDLLAIFLTSGETLIYQGSNPGSSSDWFIVGRFMTGAPYNQKCLTSFGGDLLIRTERDLISLKAAMGNSVQPDFVRAISPLVIDKTAHQNSFLQYSTTERMVVFQVDGSEASGTASTLWMLNTENMTWTLFTTPEVISNQSSPCDMEDWDGRMFLAGNLGPVTLSNTNMLAAYGDDPYPDIEEDDGPDSPPLVVVHRGLLSTEASMVKVDQLRVRAVFSSGGELLDAPSAANSVSMRVSAGNVAMGVTSQTNRWFGTELHSATYTSPLTQWVSINYQGDEFAPGVEIGLAGRLHYNGLDVKLSLAKGL